MVKRNKVYKEKLRIKNNISEEKMNLNKLSDKIVFSSLKYIKHGTLKIINHDGKNIILEIAMKDYMLI